ncbi:hypothetical protein CRG98_010956 [Punica granatum]|uniref:Germin-like protein n=1 Tax=Punica granatum TaxID=22663 RepID=A0A2I0KLI5_PUNGR|nr:hypothetical protein CRG98_010956 [Punica granatum]
MSSVFRYLIVSALISGSAAYDPDMLQDICVASPSSGANVEKIPGSTNLGASMARIDYAPGGLNPPHTTHRPPKSCSCLRASLMSGFITTANELISKTVKKGEVFMFPRGLVHYQKNNGDKAASVVAAFNSQLPGTQSIAATLFTASPEVLENVLRHSNRVLRRSTRSSPSLPLRRSEEGKS